MLDYITKLKPLYIYKIIKNKLNIKDYFINYKMSTEYEIDIYYSIGDYIYNILRPEVSGNVEMFKYILGKVILSSI